MNCFIPKRMGEKYCELYCRKSTLIKPFRFNEGTLGNDWASSIYPSNQQILSFFMGFLLRKFCFVIINTTRWHRPAHMFLHFNIVEAMDFLSSLQ